MINFKKIFSRKAPATPKIGLALGGGAGLGAAHIGVLKAVEEHGLKIDYITGTSVGALVAGLYAFGKSCDEIQEMASSLAWRDITSVRFSKFGLLSNKKMEDLLIELLGDVNIEDAKIPLAIVAADVTTGQKVVLNKGSLARAVIASTCIPGIFIPVEVEGCLLVDGGIVENVPLTTLRALGADYVIGVDLNARHTYEKPDNLVGVLLNSFHFLLKTGSKAHTHKADMIIEPPLAEFKRTRLDQTGGLVQAGYEEALMAFEKTFAVQQLPEVPPFWSRPLALFKKRSMISE